MNCFKYSGKGYMHVKFMVATIRKKIMLVVKTEWSHESKEMGLNCEYKKSK